MPETLERARRDALWTDLWKNLWHINDNDWPQQVERLREISRLALALAALIEGTHS